MKITEHEIENTSASFSNDFFIKIFDNMSVGMILIDLETMKFQYPNKAFLSLTGYKKENLHDKRPDDILLADPLVFSDLQANAMVGETLKNFEVLLKKKNGDLFWTLTSFSLIKMSKKNYAILSSLDISGSKQETDNAFRPAKVVQMPFNAIISKYPFSINMGLNKDSDRSSGRTETRRIEKFEAEKSVIKNELEIQHIEKEREEAEQAIRKNVPDIQSKEQKKKEKVSRELAELSYSAEKASKYSLSLIEASRDPLFTISPNGKITDLNEATVRVTGKSRQELIGSDFINYFTEPGKARDGYTEVFSKGFVADYPLTMKDRLLTEVLFNGSTYKDDKGRVLGAVVVARDITGQKRIEKELIEARVFAELATEIAEVAKGNAERATIIAENAVKAKQQFLSNMSHEIRTPMNAIIGFTKVLLKTGLTEKQKEYLDAIKMSGDALIVLINDILDLAKVDAGKMTFEKIPFKLASSISSMVHLFETKIMEKNLGLVKLYDASIPEKLLGDPVRLHQIIMNLISNAVKFTSQGQIKIAVQMLSVTETDVVIEFAISDTGIGISVNKIDTIFENFQQASSGTSRLFGGTGLGLAIVKQLVESQGGRITVKSAIGEGSTFSFVLNFEKTNQQATEEEEIVEVNRQLPQIKVLVVEDIPINQLLMKTLLDDFGFERDFADNGKIAIEKLRTNSYDIILMDLQMPEMNGFEATEYIRNELKSRTPIIALTADVTTADITKCKAVGMNDYVSKPVDERLLFSKIIQLVKLQRTSEKQILDEPLAIVTQKYIDLKYLNKRTKSDPAMMMEVISLYLSQTPELIDLMKQSLKVKDWSTLKSAAHKMIPSFAIMGISSDFENIARRIHVYAGEMEKTGNIDGLFDELATVCAQVCRELNDEYETLKNTLS